MFDVSLDEERANDYSEPFEDAKILVDQSYIEKFDGFQIDFVKTFFNKGFAVRPFKYGGRC